MAATLLALGVSTFYIILTSLIAYWLRKYVKYYVQQPLIRSLFLEAIATAELCGGCFELIISKLLITKSININKKFNSLIKFIL